MKWSEHNIGRALARNTFKSYLCVLPNCCVTGDEIDLLVVTPNLRIVDVEIKISRADLKRDREKDKWWQQPQSWSYGKAKPPAIAREFPRRVWKHYYAMPQDIWDDELLAEIPAVSGVLLLRQWQRHPQAQPQTMISCRRKAKCNNDAQVLTAEYMQQLARLASLRMWDAYAREEAR